MKALDVVAKYGESVMAVDELEITINANRVMAVFDSLVAEIDKRGGGVTAGDVLTVAGDIVIGTYVARSATPKPGWPTHEDGTAYAPDEEIDVPGEVLP